MKLKYLAILGVDKIQTHLMDVKQKIKTRSAVS